MLKNTISLNAYNPAIIYNKLGLIIFLLPKNLIQITKTKVFNTTVPNNTNRVITRSSKKMLVMPVTMAVPKNKADINNAILGFILS